MKDGTSEELADFLRFCASERRFGTDDVLGVRA